MNRMKAYLFRAKYPGLVFALSFLVLSYFFHTVLFAPNDYMFTGMGDGVMNYYSFMYQAEYGKDLWTFEGMNYPYYEHTVYTGAHPVHAFIISKLGLQHYGIGILNLMMLLSYPIASVFLYLILRHYKVSVLWAIVAAIAITYLTPQLPRLTGHFALSYVFAIPGMWWLLLKCRHGNAQLWGIVSFFYMMYFFMTHPYLGMILVMLSLTFWFIAYLYNRSSWKDSAGFVAVQVVLPIVLFRTLMFVTDTHVNRIDEPGGFFNFFGGWASVFAPHHGPMADVSRSIGVRMPTWESWAYVGFASMLFFVYSVAYLIYRRKELPVKSIFRHELFMFFIAAYAILIFSFCFPFKFSWARWITDFFGTLKQFRVLGRFAWIFYYIFATGTVVTLFHIYKEEGKRTLLATFFFVGMAFSFVEAYDVNKEVSAAISVNKNTFKEKHLTSEMNELATHIKDENYDAFIFLPFFHFSSENMMILGEESASFDAYMLSYHTGLPMMNCLASRLSQTESIKVNNFFGSEYLEKELTYDLPAEHKIALITNKDYLSPEELKMTYTQKVSWANKAFTVYEFDREAWNTDFYFKQVVQQEDSATIDIGKGWKSTSKDIWYDYKSWDHKTSEGLKGKGGLHGIKMDYDLLWGMDANEIPIGSYEVTFWYNHAVDRADLVTITEMYYQDREPEWVDQYDLKECTEIVGQWMRAEMHFEVTETTDSVKVFLVGNRSRKPYIVDELLVRRMDQADMFSTGQMGGRDYIIYNNLWLKRNSFQRP